MSEHLRSSAGTPLRSVRPAIPRYTACGCFELALPIGRRHLAEVGKRRRPSPPTPASRGSGKVGSPDSARRANTATTPQHPIDSE